jgi:hypothetical protein
MLLWLPSIFNYMDIWVKINSLLPMLLYKNDVKTAFTDYKQLIHKKLMRLPEIER